MTVAIAWPETAKVLQLPARPIMDRGHADLPSVQPACPFFVDWLSISQVHADGGLPLVDSGVVWAADEHGQVEWRTVKALKHEGSFETSLQVRSDGHRVTFSGNVSRFGRPDNLFGYDFFECLRRVNAVLAEYGLPAFTAGHRSEHIKRGQVRSAWSGARVSRVDLTANYCAGSMADAHAVMQYLGTQHAGRKSGRVQGQGETVDFGRGSRRLYAKAYIKALEMLRHGVPAPEVLEYCQSNGLVRFEITAKSNALTDLGCAYLGDYYSGWAMGQLINLFSEHAEVLSRCTRSTDDLDDLPKHLRGTARDYLAGMDLVATMTRATFYRHRTALLSFGLDIAVRNVKPFQPRVRVVQLAPAVVPSWYQLAA